MTFITYYAYIVYVMLKIKNKHHLNFSHTFDNLKPSHELQLAPVIDDDDELTQAINDDQARQDDDWQLAERPDYGELKEFWEEVVQEVKQDPEWTFEDD